MVRDGTLELRSEVHEVHTEGEGEGEGEGNRSSYLKMDLKSDFFDFFQTIYFWKAESLCFKNL